MHITQLTAVVLLTASLFSASLPGHLPELKKIEPITEAEYLYKTTDPSDLVKDSTVYAVMQTNVGGFKTGETVEVLRGSGQKRYHIRALDGSSSRWVDASAVKIPDDPPTNEMALTSEQLERYVNDRTFESKTQYFLWVDIDRQKVYVFTGENGDWTHTDTFDCATGINAAPTVRGTFTVSDRGTWFYSAQYEQGGKYWVRFKESYLFHSLPFDEKQSVIVDETLGERASHGCVRLAVEHSKWIYDNVKPGTCVWVY